MSRNFYSQFVVNWSKTCRGDAVA